VHSELNSHTGLGMDGVVGRDDQPIAARAVNARSPKALLKSVFREERFFLILSVFIGIFSGLAVVSFRFAIG